MANIKKYNIPVNQYALDGTYLHTYENAEIAASKIVKCVDYHRIIDCCNGKQHTSCGYQWRYTEKCNGTENIAPAPFASKNGKKVNIYTLDGIYLNTFESVNEAKDMILKKCLSDAGEESIKAKIRTCCSFGKIAYGYQWRYTDEVKEEENTDSGSAYQKIPVIKNGKRINLYTIRGKLLYTFESIQEAIIALNIPEYDSLLGKMAEDAIQEVCGKNIRMYGFCWRYAEDYTAQDFSAYLVSAIQETQKK